MFNKDFNSILDIINVFPSEEDCIKHLEELYWQGIPISPFDETSKVYTCKGGKYKCKNTGKYFNVRTGTLFDNTKIPLQKWFIAIWLITGHKKGISSLQLARDIDVTQKSAWFMLQRIRNCFDIDNGEMLNNEVEADETYVGGKQSNKHKSKRLRGTQGRSTKDKTPVVGMIERGGRLKAKKVEDVTAKTLTREIVENVKKSATLYTDEWVGYKTVNKIFDHHFVKHNKGEYVNGRIYTNTIENYWSLLKRSIYGIYHSVSKKHLQMYLDEMTFRYNSRAISEKDRFNLLLLNCGRRLKYKDLIND